MISRIYVAPRDQTDRPDSVNSYLISHTFTRAQILEIAKALTNPILEEFSIDKFPKIKNLKYAIEIGFKPGVTDNVASTVKETIADLLRTKNDSTFEVYTSKVFLVYKPLLKEDLKKIVFSLHNPLIERSNISTTGNFQNKIPKVILPKHTAVIYVSLDVSDEELVNIGKLGIMDPSGIRRGPLALDLSSMQTIRDYFKKLKRNPTDIELESLAQTWSEHCKHTIFANQIDDIKNGLYKTYIKGATNLIRKQKQLKGEDFCVSVFSDNAGGIIFDKDYLITHKVETHNSPSALDPFGGAITGIVGVNRDTIGFGLGAKPIANTYGFCFGEPDDKRALFRDKNLTQKMLSPKRIMEGVIKGINAGGNCSGIPTLSGFMKFDDRYRGKPLVFAGTIGLIPRKLFTVNKHMNILEKTDFKNLGKKYTGKVRDVYIQDDKVIMISSDRYSAFDRNLALIPSKGQVLTKISKFWFENTKDIVPNHVIEFPDPNVVVGKKCEVLPVEVVPRAYLTGITGTSLWTLYQKGQRDFGDFVLPDGMKKNQKLQRIILTPTTKSEDHDQPLSSKEIIDGEHMTKEQWEKVSSIALKLFERGQEIALQKGLILVDTKYEFGIDETGGIMLVDEIHTPDSSRYWQAKTYEERIAQGLEPENFDKEFLRLWFKENCDPYKDEKLPEAPVEMVIELSRRYIQIYEQITGEKFESHVGEDILGRIENNLKKYQIK